MSKADLFIDTRDYKLQQLKAYIDDTKKEVQEDLRKEQQKGGHFPVYLEGYLEAINSIQKKWKEIYG